MTVAATDVATYILKKRGPMTAMKLQKLVYYSQAWSLVWEHQPLFLDEIQAWKNGPVVVPLFHEHRGQYRVDADMLTGSATALDSTQAATVDSVLQFYGDMTAAQLSELTHAENPWKIARGNAAAGEPSRDEITHDMLSSFYSDLSQSDKATHEPGAIDFPAWAAWPNPHGQGE